MASFGGKLKHAWNAFNKPAEYAPHSFDYGASYGYKPDRNRLTVSTEKSMLTSIITRLSIDVASVDMQHVKLDENGKFLETIESGLNHCLTVEANTDQAARAFRQDIALTLFDKGVIAIVPVDTTTDPTISGAFEVQTLRVAEVVSWFPKHVRVNVYNEQRAMKEEVMLPKSAVAIVENPLYAVMNEPNSTLQRLTRKLSLLDQLDERTSSGKLDIIIQLPYVIKSDAKRLQAETRRKDIEMQLKGAEYGIAYTDGTEKITQLNRPVENNMMDQIEYLTKLLYSQLGLTPAVFDGTADETEMLNYHNRTIEPVLTAIQQSMKRTFLTKTARTQKQSILFFRDPFKLVSISVLAELADKLTRNEILSSNEFRSIIGFRPAADKNADELRNKNLPIAAPIPTPEPIVVKEGDPQNGS